VIATILLTVVHVIVCIFLIVVVLLQSGKAADLAGAFGGMGSQTAFGPRGSATLLSKATTISAILFMVTSMSLSIMATKGSGGGGSTILERHAVKNGTSQNQTQIPIGPPAKPVPGPANATPPQPAPAPAPAKK
jgi:preprotein translocase subunit SecG